MKKIVSLLIPIFLIHMSKAQQVMPLYDSAIPNSKPATDREKVDSGRRPGYYSLSFVSRPTLAVFLPPKDKATGTGIVICPGGGYAHLAMAHEGIEVAKKLNEMGIAAFVLKYRLPSDETMVDKEIGPLQDAQRAIQLVRQHSGDWGIKSDRLGIMGFSAGGHLASTAGTQFNRVVIDNKDNANLRPDFMVLLYPVISFSDSIGHRGSRDNLIGQHPSPEKIKEYSGEWQVTARTPPTFLVHAGDDQVVPVANSLHFYEALLHHDIPTEMHIYPHGGHGFGMNNSATKDQWMNSLKNWLDVNGWLKP
ncbi:MAG TPA: alpha/beta hydrolase [Puia sp.]|nr:alpha/beta hydrolase [Puia sp.]